DRARSPRCFPLLALRLVGPSRKGERGALGRGSRRARCRAQSSQRFDHRLATGRDRPIRAVLDGDRRDRRARDARSLGVPLDRRPDAGAAREGGGRMNAHDFHDLYVARAIEYLVAVAYLVSFVPFWRFVSRRVAPAPGRSAIAETATAVSEPGARSWFHVA